jgi:hypothetical protein
MLPQRRNRRRDRICIRYPENNERKYVRLNGDHSDYEDLEESHGILVPSYLQSSSSPPEIVSYEANSAPQHMVGSACTQRGDGQIGRFRTISATHGYADDENLSLPNEYWAPSDVVDYPAENAFQDQLVLPVTCRAQKCIHGAHSSFQLHLVPTTERTRRQEKYAVVALFQNTFVDGNAMIAACSACPQYAHDVMLFRGTTSTRPVAEAPKLCRCLHMALAVSEVLSRNGIYRKDFHESALQAILVQLCLQPRSGPIAGLYTTDIPNGNHNSYHVVVTSTSELRLFRRHGRTWGCPGCRKYGTKGCGHLRQCSDILNFHDEVQDATDSDESVSEEAALIAADSSAPVAQLSRPDKDFSKKYLVSQTLYDGMWFSCANQVMILILSKPHSQEP